MQITCSHALHYSTRVHNPIDYKPYRMAKYVYCCHLQMSLSRQGTQMIWIYGLWTESRAGTSSDVRTMHNFLPIQLDQLQQHLNSR